MAKYLIEGSYTAEGVRLLQKETASVRGQAVRKAVESLEGKVEALYFALLARSDSLSAAEGIGLGCLLAGRPSAPRSIDL